ncbi:MAG TPA: hypothetical protein VD997_03440 [Phycisphaerales bacterium]|nr:hypothetical protein [Phycisphaerales bacterium]
MRCDHCGYDTTGVTSPLCPECGDTLARVHTTLPPRLRTAAIIAGWSGWAVTALPILLITIPVALMGPGALVWLLCPGVLLALAALFFAPWYTTLRQFRRAPMLADALFVGLFPWLPGGFALALLLAAARSLLAG